MTVAINTLEAQSGWLKIKILGNAVAAGIVGSVLNPEGVLCQIDDALLYVKTGSVAASTFNIGVGASAVADYSDIVSALAVNATDGTVWKAIGTDLASESAATTPKGLLWAATSYITVTSAAAASTGLEAYLFVHYVRLGVL
jgi:hypothetical protein